MEEQKTNDIDIRVKEFNAELIPLLAKYKLGLAAQPLILSDGRIVAKPQIFDDSKSFEQAEKQQEDENPQVAEPEEQATPDNAIASA